MKEPISAGLIKGKVVEQRAKLRRNLVSRLFRLGNAIQTQTQQLLALTSDLNVVQFRILLRKAWAPRTGSRAHRRAMTASLIDSRDFLDARLREKAAALIPEGTRIAFTGGSDTGDHNAIWTALDKVRARHVDMILLHGAAPTGAERAAACWADSRGVAQVTFRPDWNRHGKAAPFKRNDRMLEALPVGLIVFPGSGIQDNLADKAARMGIPLWDFRRATR